MKNRYALMLLCFLPLENAFGSDSFLLLNRTDHFAMVRHAKAPGTGDPSNFKIGDCSTQRNLSDSGVKQAKEIGKDLSSKIGKEFSVFTSQWCRCRDTAKLLAGKDPIYLPALNSFYENRGDSDKQTKELKSWLKENLSKYNPLILVTHQVNITSLTGVFPSEGEIVVLKMNANGEITRAK